MYTLKENLAPSVNLKGFLILRYFMQPEVFCKLKWNVDILITSSHRRTTFEKKFILSSQVNNKLISYISTYCFLELHVDYCSVKYMFAYNICLWKNRNSPSNAKATFVPSTDTNIFENLLNPVMLVLILKLLLSTLRWVPMC